jgi:hypothetical protein
MKSTLFALFLMSLSGCNGGASPANSVVTSANTSNQKKVTAASVASPPVTSSVTAANGKKCINLSGVYTCQPSNSAAYNLTVTLENGVYEMTSPADSDHAYACNGEAYPNGYDEDGAVVSTEAAVCSSTALFVFSSIPELTPVEPGKVNNYYHKTFQLDGSGNLLISTVSGERVVAESLNGDSTSTQQTETELKCTRN